MVRRLTIEARFWEGWGGGAGEGHCAEFGRNCRTYISLTPWQTHIHTHRHTKSLKSLNPTANSLSPTSQNRWPFPRRPSSRGSILFFRVSSSLGRVPSSLSPAPSDCRAASAEPPDGRDGLLLLPSDRCPRRFSRLALLPLRHRSASAICD